LGEVIAVGSQRPEADSQRRGHAADGSCGGLMIVSFFPQDGISTSGFTDWQQMSTWYRNLVGGRTDASPEIKQKVAALTAGSLTPLGKMNRLAQFYSTTFVMWRSNSALAVGNPIPPPTSSRTLRRLQGQKHADEFYAARGGHRLLLCLHQHCAWVGYARRHRRDQIT